MDGRLRGWQESLRRIAELPGTSAIVAPELVSETDLMEAFQVLPSPEPEVSRGSIYLDAVRAEGITV